MSIRGIYSKNGDLMVSEQQLEVIRMDNGAYNFSELDAELGISLDGADLSELGLHGSVFREMNLNNIMFDDSQLNGSEMWGSEFYQCTFIGTDLSGVSLHRSMLQECKFENANMWQAEVAHADFIDSSLKGAVELKRALNWAQLARGNGHEVVVMQLGDQQATFVLDWAFVACQARPAHEFLHMDDAQLLEHGGKDWLRWWRKYKSTLVEFIEAHNVRAADL